MQQGQGMRRGKIGWGNGKEVGVGKKQTFNIEVIQLYFHFEWTLICITTSYQLNSLIYKVR